MYVYCFLKSLCDLFSVLLTYNTLCLSQKSMRDALKDPEILPTDFAKWEQPYQHHICYLALVEFQKSAGRNPKPYNAEDNATFVNLCNQVNDKYSLGLEVIIVLINCLIFYNLRSY